MTLDGMLGMNECSNIIVKIEKCETFGLFRLREKKRIEKMKNKKCLILIFFFCITKLFFKTVFMNYFQE